MSDKFTKASSPEMAQLTESVPSALKIPEVKPRCSCWLAFFSGVALVFITLNLINFFKGESLREALIQEGYDSGLRDGACYWELRHSETKYPKVGYYACKLETEDRKPTGVTLQYTGPFEE